MYSLKALTLGVALTIIVLKALATLLFYLAYRSYRVAGDVNGASGDRAELLNVSDMSLLSSDEYLEDAFDIDSESEA